MLTEEQKAEIDDYIKQRDDLISNRNHNRAECVRLELQREKEPVFSNRLIIEDSLKEGYAGIAIQTEEAATFSTKAIADKMGLETHIVNHYLRNRVNTDYANAAGLEAYVRVNEG